MILLGSPLITTASSRRFFTGVSLMEIFFPSGVIVEEKYPGKEKVKREIVLSDFKEKFPSVLVTV